MANAINTIKKSPNVDKIIQYESGEMSDKDTLKFFSSLVKSGYAWKLQGHYGRTAQNLIDNGLLTKSGQMTTKAKGLLGGN